LKNRIDEQLKMRLFGNRAVAEDREMRRNAHDK
jgi:hypothetical protein